MHPIIMEDLARTIVRDREAEFARRHFPEGPERSRRPPRRIVRRALGIGLVYTGRWLIGDADAGASGSIRTAQQ